MQNARAAFFLIVKQCEIVRIARYALDYKPKGFDRKIRIKCLF